MLEPTARIPSWREARLMYSLQIVDHEGIEHCVPARPGLKLMEVLRELDFGVPAICGGICSCATCHVYVDPKWAARLPSPDADEQSLVSELSQRKAESRLSCQIELTEALSGLRVTIAPDE